MEVLEAEVLEVEVGVEVGVEVEAGAYSLSYVKRKEEKIYRKVSIPFNINHIIVLLKQTYLWPAGGSTEPFCLSSA